MVRRRRGRSSSGGTWLLIVVFGIGIAATVVGLGALYMTAVENRQVLSENLCPEPGPTGQVLVLVDTTDPMSSLTRMELQALLGDVAGSVRQGELLELRVLASDSSRTDTLFSYCNPGDGSTVDAVTANPVLAQRRWEEGFATPLDAALVAISDGAGAETSPIMAGIQQIAVDHLADRRGRSTPTRLIVVSDMLENTSFFSHYRDGASFDQFVASEGARRYATDLAEARIEYWLIPRARTPISSLDLVSFWTEWASWANGRFERARQLQGLE